MVGCAEAAPSREVAVIASNRSEDRPDDRARSSEPRLRSRTAAVVLLALATVTVGALAFGVLTRSGSVSGRNEATGQLPLSDEFESPEASGAMPATTTRPATTTTEVDPTPSIPPGGSLVATSLQTEGEVPVWSTPDADSEPAWLLPAETEFWGERHFLVLEDAGDWLRVSLPVRPNGTEGWIPKDDVSMSVSTYLVRIHLDQPLLEVWQDDRLVFETTPAIGNERAPTPLGRWYIRDILQWDPASVYGPWVLALSAFSEHIEQINGSDAVVAIHGTNRPDLLGQRVSLGCIRLSNDDVTRLAQTVPAGTPVEIVA